jgi:hypothetical protein
LTSEVISDPSTTTKKTKPNQNKNSKKPKKLEVISGIEMPEFGD